MCFLVGWHRVSHGGAWTLTTPPTSHIPFPAAATCPSRSPQADPWPLLPIHTPHLLLPQPAQLTGRPRLRVLPWHNLVGSGSCLLPREGAPVTTPSCPNGVSKVISAHFAPRERCSPGHGRAVSPPRGTGRQWDSPPSGSPQSPQALSRLWQCPDASCHLREVGGCWSHRPERLPAL